jgi:hypothetical protein
MPSRRRENSASIEEWLQVPSGPHESGALSNLVDCHLPASASLGAETSPIDPKADIQVLNELTSRGVTLDFWKPHLVDGGAVRAGRDVLLGNIQSPVVTVTLTSRDRTQASPGRSLICHLAIKPPPTVSSSVEMDPTIANAITRNIPKTRLQNRSLMTLFSQHVEPLSRGTHPKW